MLNRVLTSMFGSRNERVLRQLSRNVARINALEPEWLKLSDAALRAKTDEFRARLAKGETLDDLLPEAFASVREASRRVLGHAPLRRAADRRHGAASGQDRRDAHRRRQDPGGDAAGVSQCAGGQGRARGHGQRLPRTPRLGMDGQDLRLPRHERRAWSGPAWTTPTSSGAYAADITYGTNNEFGFDYLRDNMALSQGPALPARPVLRDRRRGRLDPDRRGAHAADHLRPGRGFARTLRQAQPHRAEADPPGEGGRRRRLLRRREAEAGASVRGRHGACRAAAARGRRDRVRRRPLRHRQYWRWCITSTPACARMRSTTATSTTSCAMAK